MNLTDMESWEESYYGCNYPGMYNFIVDFFENPEDEDEKREAEAVLNWWNK